MVSLLDLKIDEVAVITKVNVEDSRKLLAMGFISGTKVLKKFESFDKKMQAFEINGSVLCIRQNICKNIFVEVGD